MNPAKVTLSTKEWELVNSTDWILTKNQVIDKVYQLFGQQSKYYRTALAKHLFLSETGIDLNSPKIAKGEQYRGLPWVMLDHPRYFTASDTFAIRSFFWWGNYCSITLQLSGKFQEKFVGAIKKYFETRLDPSINDPWFLGTGNDAWQHHFGADNYQIITREDLSGLHEKPFLKLAKKIPLTQWGSLPIFFTDNFEEMLQMLSAK